MKNKTVSINYFLFFILIFLVDCLKLNFVCMDFPLNFSLWYKMEMKLKPLKLSLTIKLVATSPLRFGSIIVCPVCEEIVEQVEKRLDDPSMKSKVVEIIKKECFRIFKPEFEKKCDDFIDQNIDQIMVAIRKMVAKDMKPDEVCRSLGACSRLSELEDSKWTIKKICSNV